MTIVTEKTVVGEESQDAIDIEVKISCYEVVLEDMNERHIELLDSEMSPVLRNSIGTNLAVAMSWIALEIGRLYEQRRVLEETR